MARDDLRSGDGQPWLAQLRLSGYALVWSPGELAAVGAYLGHVVGLSQVEARSMDGARRGTFSARYGTSPFPWHSDGAHWPVPPRYIALRALSRPSGTTFVVDASHILKIADPDSRRVGHAVWKTCTSLGSFYSSIQTFRKGEVLHRFDPNCAVPANNEAVGLSAAIESIPHSVASIAHHWSDVRETLVIDNWRMLHARSDVCLGRVMERCYVLEAG